MQCSLFDIQPFQLSRFIQTIETIYQQKGVASSKNQSESLWRGTGWIGHQKSEEAICFKAVQIVPRIKGDNYWDRHPRHNPSYLYDRFSNFKREIPQIYNEDKD